MALSADGTKLYLTVGGNTNNGAPSTYFSNTPETALTATILEIDLGALNAIPDKTFTYASGATSIYKYDLPTLDDLTVPNDGLPGHENAAGLDVSGPFGGNDGLNQAILPADAPLRIFATGLRLAYDIVVTQGGKIFTINNGSNDGLGGTPVFDAAGKPTNEINNGASADEPDKLELVVDGGYYGHPGPIRANQTGSLFSYGDGKIQTLGTVLNAAAAVPTGVQVRAGFLIDPSKFTTMADRLAIEGNSAPATLRWLSSNASTNGLTEYTSTAFMARSSATLLRLRSMAPSS